MARLTGPVPRFSLIPARWLVRHEQVDDEHVDRLAARIEAEGALFKPIVADEGSFVVLDGHHRFAALVRLGCRLAPCHLVDYNDPAIQVEHWENGAPMSKIDLVSNALNDQLYPSKTSRHRTLRAMPAQPTPLRHLHPGQGLVR